MGRGWLAAVMGLGPLRSCLPLPPQYSIAGDDAVTEGVTDLVRGTLCPALKALFEHGLKKPSLLGGACHPWLFIEEVSQGLGPCPSLSSSLRPVELAAGAGGVATGPQLDSGFDLVAPLGSLTLTPPRRQRAGRSRETSTPCIRAWCCVRRTGNLVPLAGSPGSLGWGWRSGPNPPDSVGSFRAPPPLPPGWMKTAKSSPRRSCSTGYAGPWVGRACWVSSWGHLRDSCALAGCAVGQRDP